MMDLARIWSRLDLHVNASKGFTANMLTSAFDGSDDALASSEIRRYWDELDMGARREACIEEVCKEWEAGRLEWSYEAVSYTHLTLPTILRV